MKHTEETKRKQSEIKRIQWKNGVYESSNSGFQNGHKDYTKGLVRTPEWRKKIGDSNRGKKVSAETRLKQSLAAMARGNNKPITGKIAICPVCGKEKYKYQRDFKKSKKQYCSKECAYKDFKSKSHSPNTQFSKERHPLNYKGGVSLMPGYKNIQSNIRRTRQAKLGGIFTVHEWEELKKKCSYTCLSCNKKEPEIKLTIDHIIPITKWNIWILENNVDYKCGDIKNIQPLCGSCNFKKNNKLGKNL